MPSRPKGRIAHSRRKPAGVHQMYLPGGKNDGVSRAVVGVGEKERKKRRKRKVKVISK